MDLDAGRLQVPRSLERHDLRHTHAMPLLAAGEPVKVASERLGHAYATITLSVYRNIIPTWAVKLSTGSPQLLSS